MGPHYCLLALQSRQILQEIHSLRAAAVRPAWPALLASKRASTGHYPRAVRRCNDLGIRSGVHTKPEAGLGGLIGFLELLPLVQFSSRIWPLSRRLQSISRMNSARSRRQDATVGFWLYLPRNISRGTVRKVPDPAIRTGWQRCRLAGNQRGSHNEGL